MKIDDFIPNLPFPRFKWKWASVQCTEALNDPVILLGVLFRLRKLEGRGLKYSSPELARELRILSDDIRGSLTVNLADRGGDRNIIRNSGQYWKGVGLIDSFDHSGVIRLTEFGRKVADREISQSEFAAITIQTFKLPNQVILSPKEYREWVNNKIELFPLKLILQICLGFEDFKERYITTEELTKIVMPLSSNSDTEIADYVNFLALFRSGKLHNLSLWPNCCTAANDCRIAREFLIFLSNYGYLVEADNNATEKTNRFNRAYYLNQDLENEIRIIISSGAGSSNLSDVGLRLRYTETIPEIERKRVLSNKLSRPNQAAFRKEVLKACERCVITNVSLKEVLEAAHIKPFKYKGEDTIANGFAMRSDIHTLFDTGHLRINVTGVIEVSGQARMDYGALIPPSIRIPDFTNKDFLRWRYENYNGL